jgi:hypothetical protein
MKAGEYLLKNILLNNFTGQVFSYTLKGVDIRLLVYLQECTENFTEAEQHEHRVHSCQTLEKKANAEAAEPR